MARYDAEHKARTRRRILDAAGELFRANGYAATGVKQVMAACDLTVGGFYAHFSSKERLLAEMMRESLERTSTGLFLAAAELEGEAWVKQLVRIYLSRAHRDHPEDGCALPSLTAEVARAGDETKAEFEADLLEMIDAFVEKFPPLPDADMDATDRALATVALCVGALLLSRAVKSPAWSDRILMAAKKLAVAVKEPTT